MNVGQNFESGELANKFGSSHSNGSSTGPEVSDVDADRTLRLDRRFLLFSLLAAILFSWPLLAFGRPSYIPDSAAYYKGGRAAVSYALAQLDGPDMAVGGAPLSPGSGSSATSPEQAARQASGARSITYSVAAYLFSPPRETLGLLAIIQALAAGVISVATLGAFGGLPVRRTTVALVILAGASTVAPVSFLAIPDIFAGLLIASMVLLTAASRLSQGVRLLCTGIAAFAVTAHASLIPVAAGLTILGLGWLAIRRHRGDPPPHMRWAWVIAPLLIGGLTTLAVNRIGFGETSLTAKRYPFVLARSIDSGPARRYLEEHCPELRYTVCTLYPDGLPEGGALEFLWGRDGVVTRATPDQMDRIREEEADIVLAAARAYPGYEIRTLAFNYADQMVSFRPFPFVNRLTLDQTGTPQLTSTPEDDRWILDTVHILTAISVVFGSVWLGWVFIRNRSSRPIIALVFLGILGNAATCVLFSDVAPRYQARVVWLIPLFALALGGSSAIRRFATARAGHGDR